MRNLSTLKNMELKLIYIWKLTKTPILWPSKTINFWWFSVISKICHQLKKVKNETKCTYFNYICVLIPFGYIGIWEETWVLIYITFRNHQFFGDFQWFQKYAGKIIFGKFERVEEYAAKTQMYVKMYKKSHAMTFQK